METAIFGAGCFWGVEAFFEKFEGVISTRVGYIGGTVENPTYEQVKTGETGHAEAVKIQYDPALISYYELLNTFFEVHDPTTRNRQGVDVGAQYRSVIFYTNHNQKQIAEEKIKVLTEKAVFKLPIVTEVEKAPTFYDAEEYHQKYLQKNGAVACGM
ncbi:peptide-methionine (S)-S-oxide reductase MsrA [Bacillus sp. Marseille-Q3570]|uniref:peptide-methionine (S)-S-oxide reductase MsrA n=1 Tax=Bacillus sp. Marseille-Q3570 TaxID=2963522 RepID=UPI0021B77BF1|nr:peptide-methionine (S)-S-oxide reductase MsrA [Bacillus sp. Marseille-Q3570]